MDIMGTEVHLDELSGEEVQLNGLTWGDDVGDGGNPLAPVGVELNATSREEDGEGVEVEALEKGMLIFPHFWYFVGQTNNLQLQRLSSLNSTWFHTCFQLNMVS
ncbi:unnamed protein product [Cuscuta epithymum]|uniref:Uncharacterized protein n=1 Tax=Cuscuta epithymum TaxID=186058 RepID=A0AAV0C4S7_9ASTE|nr:unnamed protein product [Cuscuta epithymum]CAH9136582.1 unnamed protein product [Cuscuta epithymum]